MERRDTGWPSIAWPDPGRGARRSPQRVPVCALTHTHRHDGAGGFARPALCSVPSGAAPIGRKHLGLTCALGRGCRRLPAGARDREEGGVLLGQQVPDASGRGSGSACAGPQPGSLGPVQRACGSRGCRAPLRQAVLGTPAWAVALTCPCGPARASCVCLRAPFVLLSKPPRRAHPPGFAHSGPRLPTKPPHGAAAGRSPLEPLRPADPYLLPQMMTPLSRRKPPLPPLETAAGRARCPGARSAPLGLLWPTWKTRPTAAAPSWRRLSPARVGPPPPQRRCQGAAGTAEVPSTPWCRGQPAAPTSRALVRPKDTGARGQREDLRQTGPGPGTRVVPREHRHHHTHPLAPGAPGGGSDTSSFWFLCLFKRRTAGRVHRGGARAAVRLCWA